MVGAFIAETGVVDALNQVVMSGRSMPNRIQACKGPKFVFYHMDLWQQCRDAIFMPRKAQGQSFC